RSYRRRRFLKLSGFNGWVTFSVLRHWARNHFQITDSSSEKKEWLFPMLEGVKVVMRYEQLEDALNNILGSMDICETVTLPRKNMTQGKRHYGEYYSDFTRRLITSYFKDELGSF